MFFLKTINNRGKKRFTLNIYIIGVRKMKSNWNSVEETEEREKTRKIIRKILLKIEHDKKNNISKGHYKKQKLN